MFGEKNATASDQIVSRNGPCEFCAMVQKTPAKIAPVTLDYESPKTRLDTRQQYNCFLKLFPAKSPLARSIAKTMTSEGKTALLCPASTVSLGNKMNCVRHGDLFIYFTYSCLHND